MSDTIQHRCEYSLACFECGKIFVTEYSNSKYCGDRCRKKKTNRVTYQNRKARAEAERGKST